MNPSPQLSSSISNNPSSNPNNFFDRSQSSPPINHTKETLQPQFTPNNFFVEPPSQHFHPPFSKPNFNIPSFDFQNMQFSGNNSQQYNDKDKLIERLMAENAKLKNDLAQVTSSNHLFTQALFGTDANSNLGTIVTVENATLVAWNQNIRRMLGYDESDLFRTVKTWRDLIHPSDLANVLTTLLSAVANRRESFFVGYKAKCKDGSVVAVKTNNFIGYDQKTAKPLFTICFVTLDSDNSNSIFAGRPFSIQQQLQQQQQFTQRMQQSGGMGPAMGKMPNPSPTSPYNRSPPSMQEMNQGTNYFSSNSVPNNTSNNSNMYNTMQRN